MQRSRRGYSCFDRELSIKFSKKSSVLYMIWGVLLQSASWKEQEFEWKGQKIILPVGTLIFGSRELSKSINIHQRDLQNWLSYLQKEGLIKLQTSKKGSLLFLLIDKNGHPKNDLFHPSLHPSLHPSPNKLVTIEDYSIKDGSKKTHPSPDPSLHPALVPFNQRNKEYIKHEIGKTLHQQEEDYELVQKKYGNSRSKKVGKERYLKLAKNDPDLKDKLLLAIDQYRLESKKEGYTLSRAFENFIVDDYWLEFYTRGLERKKSKGDTWV